MLQFTAGTWNNQKKFMEKNIYGISGLGSQHLLIIMVKDASWAATGCS